MSSTSFDIDEESLPFIIEIAQDFAIYKGIAMRALDLPKDARVPVPFCMMPSHFPERWFQFAVWLQTHVNWLLLQISHSKDFLKECLASTIETDEFTANLFKIYESVEQENRMQLSLGLIRSDYLLNCSPNGDVGLKHVEHNTIASSFGGLSPSVRDLHMYVLQKLGKEEFCEKLPKNESTRDLAKGLISAWELYANPRAIVLFVVENITTNICDQRALEYAINEFKSEIKVLRCTFAELRNCVELKEKRLVVKGNEVAVVYYRVGYMPEHYESQDWKTRLLMERSHAIKCPSVGLHLAGSKKVQLHLTRPGVIETFLPHDVAQKMRDIFVLQFSLDMNEEGNLAVDSAIMFPDRYVLKPEREGGGNNKYGEDIKTFLQEIKSTNERRAYILMQKIHPPAVPNCIVRWKTTCKPCNVACELGIYGVILGNAEVVHENFEAGHVLRSKEIGSNEGGIVAGFGALDSPYLI